MRGGAALGAIIVFFIMTHQYSNTLKPDQLHPIADGRYDSADWSSKNGQTCNTTNCFNQINDIAGGTYCNNLSDGDNSYVQSSTKGAMQTFVIDISDIPNGTHVTKLDALVCGLNTDPAQHNKFQTVLCINGTCHPSGTDITPDDVYSSAIQTYTVDFIKSDSTKVEMGYKITGSGGKIRMSWASTTTDRTQRFEPAPTLDQRYMPPPVPTLEQRFMPK